MRKYFEIAAWAAGLIFVVWAISFGAFWMVRSGCAGAMDRPQCNGAPIIEWYGNLVSLGWVKRYQELLSGFMALLAGATVLLASYIQIHEARSDARAARAERVRAHFSAVRGAALRAHDLMYSGDISKFPGMWAAVRTTTLDTAQAGRRFAEAIEYMAQSIDEALAVIFERRSSGKDVDLMEDWRTRYGLVYVVVLIDYLKMDPPDDGKITKRPRADLEKTLEEHDVIVPENLSEFTPLYAFYSELDILA